jgi:hypothetical protein
MMNDESRVKTRHAVFRLQALLMVVRRSALPGLFCISGNNRSSNKEGVLPYPIRSPRSLESEWGCGAPPSFQFALFTFLPTPTLPLALFQVTKMAFGILEDKHYPDGNV